MNDKCTVLNVGQRYCVRGGSDRYFMELTNLLRRKGHRVIPFVAADPANEPTEYESFFPRGADVVKPGAVDLVRFVYSQVARSRLEALLDAHPVKVAHLHLYYGKLTASILKPLKERGIPIVQTLHDFRTVCPVGSLNREGRPCEDCEGHRFWRAIPRRCNRGSLPRTVLSVSERYVARQLGSVRSIDQFLAVSEFLRRKVVGLGMPDSRVQTLHNFVDATAIEPATGAGEYILFFGRLEHQKGVMTLLKAAERLSGVRFVLAGDGSARKQVEDVVRHRGLRNVCVVGFQDGPPLDRLIRSAKCIVVPSVAYETFGLAILEAFVRGRAVIASDIGGIPEVMRDGVEGFLVKPHSVDALASRLRWIVENPVEAAVMGARGRERVQVEFCPERHYAALMGVYAKVCGEATVS